MSQVFEKFFELPWYAVAVVLLLIVLGIALIFASKKVKWNAHRIAMASMCIAIGFVLSNIRLFHMPHGGSVTPASMLPLILFMVAEGPLPGFVIGCAYGFLQLLASPYVIHPVQLLVDYPFAYAAMVLCCLVSGLNIKREWKLPLAVILGGIGRYAMAVFSGAVFFAEYAGEQNAWIYSIVYNIGYLGVDTLICAAIACVPGMTRLVDLIKGKR